jgi:endonuclease-3 related protein
MPTNTAASRSRSKRRTLLLRLYNRLLKHFGPQHWWPADHAWEMMVGAILTQNTAWTNVEKALKSLKQSKSLSIPKIATMPSRRLESLIRSSGYFRQKAERLQRLARYLEDNPLFYKQLTGQKAATLMELRAQLLAMNGIGPETVDSILLYAGAHPIFVVDAYTRRIGQRYGLFKTEDYHEVQAYFEEALPKKSALYNEFHALIVHLAKDFCRKHDPLCGLCPLGAECQTSRKRLSSTAPLPPSRKPGN